MWWWLTTDFECKARKHWYKSWAAHKSWAAGSACWRQGAGKKSEVAGRVPPEYYGGAPLPARQRRARGGKGRSILVNTHIYIVPRAEWRWRARLFPGELQSARGTVCARSHRDPL